jgi:hypothetical protein
VRYRQVGTRYKGRPSCPVSAEAKNPTFLNTHHYLAFAGASCFHYSVLVAVGEVKGLEPRRMLTTCLRESKYCSRALNGSRGSTPGGQ